MKHLDYLLYFYSFLNNTFILCFDTIVYHFNCYFVFSSNIIIKIVYEYYKIYKQVSYNL